MGIAQTVSSGVDPGSTADLEIRIRNDGSYADRFHVKGCRDSPGVVLTFLQSGRDITVPVMNGAYTTPRLLPGGHVLLDLHVRAKVGASAGVRNDCLVTVSSSADPVKQDAVKAVLVVL